MTGAGLLGLLVLKHGLLAHVVDFGYSASRRSTCRYWYVALVLQCLAEMVGTLFVLSNYSLHTVSIVLLVEMIGLSMTAVVERSTSLDRLLIRHVMCELAMLTVYALIASYLVIGQ
jgi:hypothetical protein